MNPPTELAFVLTLRRCHGLAQVLLRDVAEPEPRRFDSPEALAAHLRELLAATRTPTQKDCP